MATNKVIGGKKLNLALTSIAQKITSGGVLRVGFLEASRYAAKTNAKFLKAVGSKAAPKTQAALSVAQVAFWNEYGTITAPSRPFFRTTIKAQSKEWGAKLSAAVVQYNYDGKLALAALGQSMRDDIENAIAQWAAPGNAPLTIKIKGFDKPLVDTGVMQRAVDYTVE